MFGAKTCRRRLRWEQTILWSQVRVSRRCGERASKNGPMRTNIGQIFVSIGATNKNIYWIFSMTWLVSRDSCCYRGAQYRFVSRVLWSAHCLCWHSQCPHEAYRSECSQRLTKCCRSKGKHTKGRNNVCLRRCPCFPYCHLSHTPFIDGWAAKTVTFDSHLVSKLKFPIQISIDFLSSSLLLIFHSILPGILCHRNHAFSTFYCTRTRVTLHHKWSGDDDNEEKKGQPIRLYCN